MGSQLATDPDARLYKESKGTEAKPCYAGHMLMENRNGLVVASQITKASGTAKRAAALQMLSCVVGYGRATVAADKAYDTSDFVERLRQKQHDAACNAGFERPSEHQDGWATRHAATRSVCSAGSGIKEIFGRAEEFYEVPLDSITVRQIRSCIHGRTLTPHGNAA